jgi:hypothetical protein
MLESLFLPHTAIANPASVGRFRRALWHFPDIARRLHSQASVATGAEIAQD